MTNKMMNSEDYYNEEDFREGICARIKEAREEAKLTQQQLADSLGTHQRQIVRWETDRVPDVTTLMKISKITGVTINFLVGDFPKLPTSWHPMIVIPTTDDTPQTAEEAKRLLEEATGDEEELEDIEENLAEGWLEWLDGALVSWIDGEEDEKQTRRFLMYVR